MFLNLSTVDILGQIILCCWGRSAHCGKFSSHGCQKHHSPLPSLHVVTIETVCRHGQKSPGGLKSHLVDSHYFKRWKVFSYAIQSCQLSQWTVIPWKWKWSCSVTSNSLRPLGTVVHGILQARILEWVAFPSSRWSSQPRDRNQVSCIAGGFFTSWATREAQEYWSG